MISIILCLVLMQNCASAPFQLSTFVDKIYKIWNDSHSVYDKRNDMSAVKSESACKRHQYTQKFIKECGELSLNVSYCEGLCSSSSSFRQTLVGSSHYVMDFHYSTCIPDGVEKIEVKCSDNDKIIMTSVKGCLCKKYKKVLKRKFN